MGYTHEYSSLPNKVFNPPTFKDLGADPTVNEIVMAIKQYQAQGNYATANSLLLANAELLKPYMFNAENINAIDEEICNLEVMCYDTRQSVYFTDTQPTTGVGLNDVWIGKGAI